MGMSPLVNNLKFWHEFPAILTEGLTHEQLRWQPEQHDTSIIFALWHTYRAEDEILHALLTQGPSVFASQGWAARLPVTQVGATPFGNGFAREQIASLDLDIAAVLAYAEAVGASEIEWLSSASEEERAAEIKLPFFTGVYPHVDALSKEEAIAFFAIGHNSEHLGEVQIIKGLMGMKGAPL
jgi:hypothetical protein